MARRALDRTADGKGSLFVPHPLKTSLLSAEPTQPKKKSN